MAPHIYWLVSRREPSWDLDAAPRIDGSTAIVTGAASGLGAHITKMLCMKGAHVVMADIDVDQAKVQANEIRSSVQGALLQVIEIDLGDLHSIKRFSDRFISERASLDLLINNAGIMTPPYGRTKQGHESQWGVNHLGHFALTGHLLSTLINTPGSRIITQSSIVHRGGTINFQDINSERAYGPWKAYKQSKLATLLFSRELQRRLDLKGIDAPKSVACHPGLVDTPLYRNGQMMRKGLKPFMHGIGPGVMPALRAALDPEVRGGDFYGPDGWMEFKGGAVLVEPHKRGRDMDLANRVWMMSEKMTGMDLTALLEGAAPRNGRTYDHEVLQKGH